MLFRNGFFPFVKNCVIQRVIFEKARTSITNVRNFNTLRFSPNAKTNKHLLDHFIDLPLPCNLCIVEYVWIDGTGVDVRSKTRVLDYVPKCPHECPMWSYDGSSTQQAPVANGDIYLNPVALYNDPFRKSHHKLLMCDTYTGEKKPTSVNRRHSCLQVCKCCEQAEPWFGFEQEFIMMDMGGWPLGWPLMRGEPKKPSGDYYCSVGAEKGSGRDILECIGRGCMYAGIPISGINLEAMKSQAEYQVGVCKGIAIGDDVWMGRFIAQKTGELFGCQITFHPKPILHWPGSGGHMNFSTAPMRKEGGLAVIKEAICGLEKHHVHYCKATDISGNNKLRLTGRFETSSAQKFSSGVADRTVSVRLMRQTVEKGKGHLEDRRPPGDTDPYVVCELLLRATVLKE